MERVGKRSDTALLRPTVGQHDSSCCMKPPRDLCLRYISSQHDVGTDASAVSLPERTPQVDTVAQLKEAEESTSSPDRPSDDQPHIV
jgi:hypothetical protein